MTKYFTRTYDQSDGLYQNYTAVSDTGIVDKHNPYVTLYPMARVGVTLAQEVPLHSNPEIRIMNAMRHAHPDDIAEAIEQQETTPQMFFPKPAVIDSAFADPSMRLHVGTLLGQVLNDHGKSLRATYELSPYSSRLARKGIEAGVIQGHPRNPEADEYNNIGFDTHNLELLDNKPLDVYQKAVPDHLVDRGRRTMRNLLRPKPLSPQFQALQQLENDRGSTYNPADDPNAMKLPGMED